MKPSENAPFRTGVPNLDELLGGGVPSGSVVVLGGPPGSGKTILSQQMAFNNVSPERQVLFVQTLSEPTAKTLRYLRDFTFFEEKLIGKTVHFVDLGDIMRSKGLELATSMLMERVRQLRPAIVVVDSFKVFSDLAGSREELRKFSYEVAVSLMAWDCTAFLLGEFSFSEIQASPLGSIVDGIIMLSSEELSGEQQRFIQIIKVRGTKHDRDRHPLEISNDGISIYAPRAVAWPAPFRKQAGERPTGIAGLDRLLGGGFPAGSSILLSGASGTGKSVVSLETLYRRAKKYGKRGLYYSFNGPTNDQVISSARSLGWDLRPLIKKGLLQIVAVPQLDILVDAQIMAIQRRIEEFDPEMIVVDSLTALLRKVRQPEIIWGKVFHLAEMIRNSHRVAMFIAERGEQPKDKEIHESLFDGVIYLDAVTEGEERARYIEIYKLREKAHLMGRHPIEVLRGGVTVHPRRVS